MESFARLDAIFYYLANGSHQLGSSRIQMSSVGRAAKQYVLDMGKLYYVNSGKRRLVVRTPEERDRVLYECHDSAATGEHPGVQKTAQKAVQHFYWLTLKKDVEDWVGSCEPCQRHDRIKTVAPTLHPIKVQGPWQVMGVDLIGPLKTTSKGYIHIISFTDLFSKWVMARPLRGKNGPGVGLMVTQTVLAQGGVKKIITDMGREFVNDCNKALFETFGIEHAVTSAYHPQSNGQDERSNQNIKRHLAKYCNEERNDWDVYLQHAVYSINTSKQRSTKVSPYFAIYRVHHGSSADPKVDDFEIANSEETLQRNVGLDRLRWSP